MNYQENKGHIYGSAKKDKGKEVWGSRVLKTKEHPGGGKNPGAPTEQSDHQENKDPSRKKEGAKVHETLPSGRDTEGKRQEVVSKECPERGSHQINGLEGKGKI